jgi:lipoyl(octanoyl) transferase
MAVDEALADSVRITRRPVLRIYRWSPRCLSLGRNQPAEGHYDVDAIRKAGADVVRRPTGGRAVLHDRELTYGVAVPDGMLGSPRETYRRIHSALVAGLLRLGVTAEMRPRSARRASPPSLVPCFREPAEGEIVAGGSKLVGSAQVRLRGTILQHGSLLMEDSQAAVGEWTRGGAPLHPAGAPATLAYLMGRIPAWGEVVEALVDGWRDTMRAPLRESMLMEEESVAADRLSRHYQDPAWTWHR